MNINIWPQESGETDINRLQAGSLSGCFIIFLHQGNVIRFFQLRLRESCKSGVPGSQMTLRLGLELCQELVMQGDGVVLGDDNPEGVRFPACLT